LEDLTKFITGGVLRVCAKAGKKKTSIIGFDESKKAVVVEIGAPAKDNKANIELIKFLSKKLKKNVVMKSGFTSKEKTLIVG
jgi:uncharacterized protein (TIGR00251 family)